MLKSEGEGCQKLKPERLTADYADKRRWNGSLGEGNSYMNICVHLRHLRLETIMLKPERLTADYADKRRWNGSPGEGNSYMNICVHLRPSAVRNFNLQS